MDGQAESAYVAGNTMQCDVWSQRKAADLSQNGVLIVSDWNTFILGSVRDDFNQTTNLCLVVEGHAEQL